MSSHSNDSQLHDTVFLSTEDFEYLCFNSAREFLSFKEPIPDYSTRDNPLLESALGSPKQTFGGEFLYPTIVDQSAILFYSIIKNHPFKNGNKRIAVMTMLVFLSLNNKWINIPQKLLYEIAVIISASKSKDNDDVLLKIKNIIKKFLIPFPK